MGMHVGSLRGVNLDPLRRGDMILVLVGRELFFHKTLVSNTWESRISRRESSFG
jgi:hypothetical protein